MENQESAEDFSEPEEGLFEHFRFVVDMGQSPVRIDKYLLSRIERVSRNKIQAAAEDEMIFVNGKIVRSNYKVRPQDEIVVMLPEPKIIFETLPENIPLNIVYEDDDLVIVNKPAGLVVHPGAGNYTGTLVNGLMYHFQHLPSSPGNSFRAGLVHRIDKNTSGLLVVAKNEYALNFLARQFSEHSIERSYVALVWGDFKNDEGTVKGHIGRSTRNRKVMDVFPEGDHGKEAITHYRVIERFMYVTLIECKLQTGRTHQIRAHMQHIGHPLFNDETYGGNRIVKGTVYTKYKQFVENCFALLPRQALHAKSLGFVHPASNEKVFFDSELPGDMMQVIEKWREYVKR
jgi:23S rRNA pseudouridine1911/1915/1917 synthase